MTTYYVATRATYVLVEAEDEDQARAFGRVALSQQYEALLNRTNTDTPINICSIRPATDDEIALVRWHNATAAREVPTTHL